MTTWGVALLKFLNEFVRALPLIAVWIANRMGRSQGIKEQQAADQAVNAEAQAEYAEIATQGTSDEQVDSKLDSGNF